MAKIMIPASKQPLYKKIGLLLVAVFTVYVFYHGAQYGIGSTPTPKYSNVVSSDTGFKYSKVETPKYTGAREKATFVTLVRNRDLYSLAESIKSVEDRFNSKFNYDWVFLNDEEFTEEFKKPSPLLWLVVQLNTVLSHTSTGHSQTGLMKQKPLKLERKWVKKELSTVILSPTDTCVVLNLDSFTGTLY